jgi:soluble cytochrome b562
MTKQELQEAYRSTPEWEDYRKKEQIWTDLLDKANEYAEKVNEAQTITFDSLAALYATKEYKAWAEGKE